MGKWNIFSPEMVNKLKALLVNKKVLIGFSHMYPFTPVTVAFLQVNDEGTAINQDAEDLS